MFLFGEAEDPHVGIEREASEIIGNGKAPQLHYMKERYDWKANEVPLKMIKYGPLLYYHMDPAALCPLLDKQLEVIIDRGDLEPGVYEGGFKVWECTYDLLCYLQEENILVGQGNGYDGCDIGCGSGILGCYMAQSGLFQHITMMDYNPEVLRYYTFPNLQMNLPESNPNIEIVGISGDWKEVLLAWQGHPQQYDLIVSSETIYSNRSCILLCQFIKLTLKPQGACYVAAKSYYFGVGGGCRYLEQVCAYFHLAYQTVKVVKDGNSNIREIIRIGHPSPTLA